MEFGEGVMWKRRRQWGGPGKAELHVGGWDLSRGQRDDGGDDRRRPERSVEDEDGQEEDFGGKVDEGESGDGRRCAVADGGGRW